MGQTCLSKCPGQQPTQQRLCGVLQNVPRGRQIDPRANHLLAPVKHCSAIIRFQKKGIYGVKQKSHTI